MLVRDIYEGCARLVVVGVLCVIPSALDSECLHVLFSRGHVRWCRLWLKSESLARALWRRCMVVAG